MKFKQLAAVGLVTAMGFFCGRVFFKEPADRKQRCPGGKDAGEQPGKGAGRGTCGNRISEFPCRCVGGGCG